MRVNDHIKNKYLLVSNTMYSSALCCGANLYLFRELSGGYYYYE